MTKKFVKQSVIELPQHAVAWLWNQLIKTFINKPDAKVPEALINSPEKFWKSSSVKQRFYIDFTKVTRFKNSGMRLFSKSRDNELDDIPINYLRDHFINFKEKFFQEDYLNKIIFYITEDIRTAEYNTFFELHGININIEEPNRNEMSPGLKNMEGYWIGLNKNLEDGAFAKCFYRFLQVDNIMQVQREAYNAEISYEGLVHVQDDSNYLIELEGKSRRKKKFIIADAGKLKPQSIRCLSSGFDIATGNPIIVKELLFKIPSDVSITISTGIMIEESKIEKYLKSLFDIDLLPLVMDEIKDYLGNKEVSFYSLMDLSNIKKKDLNKINLGVNEQTIVSKRVSAYIHFNKFDTKPYERNVIKYHRNSPGHEESQVILPVKVYDEYLYIKNTQYESEDFIKHRVHAHAEDKNGAVDIQSLFPILDDDSDNDLTEPMLIKSNRMMDAFSDTFISSATVINDFSKTLRIPLKYDVETKKSEIVFDFCSVPHFLNKGISISEIVYMFNEADGEGLKIIKIKPENKNTRGFHLKKLDKTSLNIEFEETFSIDKKNEGIFSVKIDFQSEKDEAIYFQFKKE